MSERILLVEDEAAIANVLRDALEARGFRPIWIDHGEQAAAAMAAGGFDLIVLDVMLPEVNGFELLRRLRAAGDAISCPP